MEDPNYGISLMIFIIVAFIVASLTVKLQRQMDIANRRTEITTKLNAIGSGFLNLAGRPAIARYSCDSLKKLTEKRVDILIRSSDNEEFSDSIAEWCYRNSMICGHGEAQFGENTSLYVPIKNSNKTYGVIIFDCCDGDLEEEEKVYVDTVISQITLVLERERLNEEKEETREGGSNGEVSGGGDREGELSEEEKKAAREAAIKKLQEEEGARGE